MIATVGVLLVLLVPLQGKAQDLVVAPGSPLPTITEALMQARPGDHILVKPGVYREPTLLVDKSVTITGEGDPVLDGEGQRQIMTVTADSVVVRGLVFRDVGTSFVEDRAALKVDGARHCVIEGNRFEKAFFALYLAKASACRLADNQIHGATATESRSGNGIHLWYSRDILIENNQIRGHRDGIYLEFVEDSVVRGNVSEHNLRYGLHFMFSDRCAYRDNVLRDNDAGVAVMYSEDVEIKGNRFAQNWGSAAYGLLLKDITDSKIEGNTFFKNTIGLYAEGANRLSVAENEFRENGWAVKLMANSRETSFTRNTFIANTFDVATNSRHTYSTFRENYWDAYTGYDLDRDGYGDVPFRPVRLFSLIVEQNEPSLILMRSFFIDLLDAAERVLPALTPETLLDEKPRMRSSLETVQIRHLGLRERSRRVFRPALSARSWATNLTRAQRLTE